MFSQIIRWSLLVAAWKKYRLHAVTAVALIVGWLVIEILHQDYVQYVQISNQQESTYLGWSFVVKWLLDISLIAGASWFVKKSVRESGRQSQLHKDMGRVLNQVTGKGSEQVGSSANDQLEDPFENIRRKKQLRSKADVIIEKKLD